MRYSELSYESISGLGKNRLKLGHELTQTWVRIESIWVRNDRGYETTEYLGFQGKEKQSDACAV